MISSKDFDRVRIFTKFVKGRCTSAAPKKENPGALRDREVHSVSAKPTGGKKFLARRPALHLQDRPLA
jgi:hypothetical protein